VTDHLEPMLQQDAVAYAFGSRVRDRWVTLYRNWREDDSNGSEYAALTPVERRRDVLADASWELTIGGGTPGFSQWSDHGTTVSEYSRIQVSFEGAEPLIIVQEHMELLPDMLPQLCEEFRLYHNLWMSPDGTKAKAASVAGEVVDVARITQNHVEVRLPYLIRYAAGRQTDIVLYIDSVRFFPGLEATADELQAIGYQTQTERANYFLHAGTVGGEYGPFSRLCGKVVVPAPPLERAGIWPFKLEDGDEYTTFIISENEHGDPVEYTCDPDALANYFGANPDAPNYLTPVFFDRAVLDRYYADERYRVGDGNISCGRAWSLRLDNDSTDHVIVFLGDLGEYLPARERPHWRTHNIAPVGHMSETLVRRAFLGQPASPQSADLRFRHDFPQFCADWEEEYGWPLFKPLNEADEHLFRQLRIPSRASHAELEPQVLALTKMLVDSLNERKLSRLLGASREGERGISKLERWLESQDYTAIERDIGFLRRLQSLRSKLVAHRKDGKIGVFLQENEVAPDAATEVTSLLEQALSLLDGLRQELLHNPDGG
jgi:hypothetical protein